MRKILSVLLVAMILAASVGVISTSAAETQSKGYLDFTCGYFDTANFSIHPSEGASYSIHDGKLFLNKFADGSYIAPQGTYDQFTMQFDVSAYDPPVNWVGVALGQPAADALFWDKSQLFGVFNDGILLLDFVNGGNPLVMAKSDTVPAWNGGVRTWAAGNDVLIDDPDSDTFGQRILTFKIVLKDKKVTAYRKNSVDNGQDERFKTIEGQWENVANSTGYVKICFTGATNVALSNIKFSPVADDNFDTFLSDSQTVLPATANAPAVTVPAGELKTNTFALNWTDMGAASYVVKLFDANKSFLKAIEVTSPSASFADLSEDTAYGVQVVALDGNKLALGYSALAEVKTAKTADSGSSENGSTTGNNETSGQDTDTTTESTTGTPGGTTSGSNPQTADSFPWVLLAVLPLSLFVLKGMTRKVKA